MTFCDSYEFRSQTIEAFVLYCASLALEEARSRVIRTFKQYYGKIMREEVRSPALNQLQRDSQMNDSSWKQILQLQSSL